MRVSLAALPAVAGRVCHEGSDLTVEALVMSGTDNPKFALSSVERLAFCAVLESVNGITKLPTCRTVGFTGFQVCGKTCSVFRGDYSVDHILYQMMREHVELTQVVLDHIYGEMQRLESNGGDFKCPEDPPQPAPDASCDAEVAGSDDPTTVHYDPQNDDGGCFLSRQSDNNCYDYGTDIATNTFAQPGRGSGQCAPTARPCVPNTCDDVKAAAVADGLEWIGTDLPTKLPEAGHYVSLHIWPQSNFHWLRMDADMYWSHKPGGSPVRNTDNNGDKIQDPAKADVSPWSTHCGYLLATPSKLTIKASEQVVV